MLPTVIISVCTCMCRYETCTGEGLAATSVVYLSIFESTMMIV